MFVHNLGSNVKGTVLYVSANNLGAHSFAGFQETFNVNVLHMLSDSSCTVDIQQYEVRSGVFTSRNTRVV